LAICNCCDVPLNFSSNSPTLIPAENRPLQQDVMEKRLLRFDATLPEMARGLIVAYRDAMKKVDANTVVVHAF
jgi:hypothetical protein